MPFGPKSVDYEQMNIISLLSDFIYIARSVGDDITQGVSDFQAWI